MNLIDFLILLWMVAAATRGFEIGLIRQLLSFAGFLIGLLAGGWLAPHLSELSGGGSSRLLITLMSTLGLALLLSAAGDRLGIYVHGSLKVKQAHLANSLLGVVLSIGFVLFSSWLIASALTRLPFANTGLAVEDSRIIQGMNKVMPPAPAVIERIGRLISPQGFPQVFVGPEPEIDPAGPPATPEVEAAAAKASDSTVRIEGSACGGISTGSGYVAAPNYVVTNAHVVAGARTPVVVSQGERQRAVVVWFDPGLDFAVLRTNDSLPGPPLPLAEQTVPRGSSAAVLGYPGGGSLRISPSVVLRSQLALGRDIYDRSLISREIYALQVNIEAGNSGGPVVLADGKVAGIIFGETATNDGVGYALTSQAIADGLSAALTRNTAVSSGSCL